MDQPASGPAKPLTPERILQMAWGYAPPLIIAAAVQHKYFDTVSGGPITAEQVAQRTQTSPRGARMILNALVGLDLMNKDVQSRYTLTPESATFMVSTRPGYRGAMFNHTTTQLIPQWLQIKEVVRTGRPVKAANQESEGAAYFEQFVEDIFPNSYAPAKALGDHLKLAAATSEVRVLDLAAGSGVWGIALAEKSPMVKVTAVDWPGVLPVTRRVAARHGVGDRFTYIEGDLNAVPFGAGFNVATLGHIIHSEGEARSRALVKKTFDALAAGGTIAIQEFLANDDRTGPAQAMIFAVNMLVNTDEGDTYSFAEIGAWLNEAGFVNPRLLEAPGPSPLILADKP